MPLCVLCDLIHAVISRSQKGSARYTAECQGPPIEVSLHCSSPDISHLQIIAGALRHIRMAAYKSTNELPPPPPPPSFSSFAIFLFYFYVPITFPVLLHAGFRLVSPVFICSFSLSFRFFIPLFPTSFIYGFLSFSISRYLIHFSLLLSVRAVSSRFPSVQHSGLALSKSEMKNMCRRASTAAGKGQTVWLQGIMGVRLPAGRLAWHWGSSDGL